MRTFSFEFLLHIGREPKNPTIWRHYLYGEKFEAFSGLKNHRYLFDKEKKIKHEEEKVNKVP